jgi:hypothetical protein
LAATIQDPFDGRPVRTRIEEGVFVAWSVGKDRIDQGGAIFPVSHSLPLEETFRGPDDLVWCVRLP